MNSLSLYIQRVTVQGNRHIIPCPKGQARKRMQNAKTNVLNMFMILHPYSIIRHCRPRGAVGSYCSIRNRDASMPAMLPVPAAMTAWRKTGSCTSPAANTPSTLVLVLSGFVMR